MLFSVIFFTSCLGLLFRREGREGSISLDALNWLKGDKVSWRREAEQMMKKLESVRMGPEDVVWEGASTWESWYFLTLLSQINFSISVSMFESIPDHLLPAIPILDQWAIVKDAPRGSVRTNLVRKILHLSKPNDNRIIAEINNGLLREEGLEWIFTRLWQNPIPFTGAHQPNGPFARTLLALGIIENVEGLSRFKVVEEWDDTSSTSQADDDSTMSVDSQEETVTKRGIKRTADTLEETPQSKKLKSEPVSHGLRKRVREASDSEEESTEQEVDTEQDDYFNRRRARIVRYQAL